MNSVECPYCGAYIDYSEFNYLEMEDDDSKDYECGNCNKEFELYSYISPNLQKRFGYNHIGVSCRLDYT